MILLQVAGGIILAFIAIAVFMRFGLKPFIIAMSVIVALILTYIAYMNLQLYPDKAPKELAYLPSLAIVAFIVFRVSRRKS